MSVEEVRERYLRMHEELRKKYYERKELSKEEFDRLHQKLWSDYEKELANLGVARVDFREAYRKAKTVEEKLSIIAKYLGLEG